MQTSDKSKVLAIEDGTIKHTCFEPHRRGKNWVAKVAKNLRAPGGLERQFFQKASGSNYILPEDLHAGDYLEFGGDYYTTRGRPIRTREYYLVTNISWGNPGKLWLNPIEKKDVGRKNVAEDPKPKRLVEI